MSPGFAKKELDLKTETRFMSTPVTQSTPCEARSYLRADFRRFWRRDDHLKD